MSKKPLDEDTENAMWNLGLGERRVDVAVVLGSGLGGGADTLEVEREISYRLIPGLGVPSVPGHGGVLKFGTLDGVSLAVFCGRRHYYENGSMGEAAMGARLAAFFGAKLLILVSAVGGADPELPVGSFVFISDHINLMGVNPLVGESGENGPPFVDLTDAYRRDLYMPVRTGLPQSLLLQQAILAAFTGPTYETPAEVEMARRMGAGVVGMSTVPEVVYARYLGIDTVAYGLVANSAAGVNGAKVSHANVVARASAGAADASTVVAATLAAWKKVGG